MIQPIFSYLDKSSWQAFNTRIRWCFIAPDVQYSLSACHTVSFLFLNQQLNGISSIIVLMRLLVLFLFHVSLAGSQPTQSSQQAPGPPHPAGDQSSLGSGNLSFPWSRLRLPRYALLYLRPTNRKLTRKCQTSVYESQIKKSSTYFFIGTSFLFTTASSCTQTSQASVSLAQCRSRLMSRTIQTGLYCTARVYRSPRPPYWTRTSLICLTR